MEERSQVGFEGTGLVAEDEDLCWRGLRKHDVDGMVYCMVSGSK